MRVVRFRPIDQHDSEASFVSHHASVSFGSLCQRNDSIIGRIPCRKLKESGSSASVEEPVIVPSNPTSYQRNPLQAQFTDGPPEPKKFLPAAIPVKNPQAHPALLPAGTNRHLISLTDGEHFWNWEPTRWHHCFA